jgi:hypothetical protein
MSAWPSEWRQALVVDLHFHRRVRYVTTVGDTDVRDVEGMKI